MPQLKFQTLSRWISTLSIAIALFSLSGGHWAALQSIAWAKMIRTYSSQSSLSSAVEKTFDGQHRCSLCKKIEQAKRQEKKNNFVNEAFQKKKGILAEPISLLTLFPKQFNFFQMRKSFYGSPIMQPATPPPQVA